MAVVAHGVEPELLDAADAWEAAHFSVGRGGGRSRGRRRRAVTDAAAVNKTPHWRVAASLKPTAPAAAACNPARLARQSQKRENFEAHVQAIKENRRSSAVMDTSPDAAAGPDGVAAMTPFGTYRTARASPPSTLSGPGGRGARKTKVHRGGRKEAAAQPVSATGRAVLPLLGGAAVSTADRWFGEAEGSSVEAALRDMKDVTATAAPNETEICPVCHDRFGDFAADQDETDTRAWVLPRCIGEHAFHHDCIRESLRHNPRCPVCMLFYETPKGPQPNGTMSVSLHPRSQVPLQGCRDDTLMIRYSFPSGIQDDRHPHPGQHYSGTNRVAYLPASPEGIKVLGLLQRAWDSRVLFQVGQSITTGVQNTTVWNGIHHKTELHGGPFGYPDPTYLTRVTEELAAAGIC